MLSYESTKWFENYFDAQIVGNDRKYNMLPQFASYAHPMSEPSDIIDIVKNDCIIQNIITIKIPEEHLNFIVKTFQQLDSEQEMRRRNADLNDQYQSYTAMLNLLYSFQIPYYTKLY